MPRSAFRAAATRYDRSQLLWLLALRRLRETERLPLADVRSRLSALSPGELEALATQGLAPGPLADALGLRAGTPPDAAPPLLASGEALGAPLPRWSRIELALGLELHVRDDASPTTLELARRIHALCVAR